MLRDLVHAWCFSGMLSVLALAGAGTVADQPALAQTGAPSPSLGSPSHPCHLLTSAQSVPDGHGAAYDVFSAAKELLLGVECGSSSNATLTVGNGRNTTYIYRVAYEWINGAWKEIALSGSQRAASDWYEGTATADLMRSQAQLAEDNFVVAYTCLWQNNAWECGCRDSSCSQNYWQLQAFAFSSGGSSGGNGGTIPAATRTINVSSGSQLSSAISNAQAGDHIVLADGTYSGFTVSRSGQNGKPIVIRAANTLGAKINGNIRLSGNYTWAIGFDVVGGGSGRLEGVGGRISSSRFRSNGRSISTAESARSAIIDHNEIDSQSKGTETGWFGIALLASAEGASHHHHIFRNYLYGAPALKGGDDNTAIGCSVNGSRWATKTENTIEYNLIEDWYGDDEIIMAKASNCIIQFNTLIGGKEFDSRVGNGSKFIANWLEKDKGIRIHGKNHVVIGNRASQIRIYAGDGDNFGGSVSYVTTENTIVAGNTGNLIVGATINGRPNHPSKNTTVEAHNGSISYGKHVGTKVSETATRTIPQAFKLTPSQVGPNAPTAPKLAPTS